jgi:hypothetical protein
MGLLAKEEVETKQVVAVMVVEEKEQVGHKIVKHEEANLEIHLHNLRS